MLIGGASLIVALSACGSDDRGSSTGTSSKESSTAPSASANSDAPRVEILDPGDEPREKIRLSVKPGDRAHREMTMRIAMQMTLDGTKVPAASIPATVVGINSEVTQVDADGVITTEFGYDDVRLDGGGKGVRELEKQMQTMNGVSGVLTSTDTGVVLDADMDIPSDVPSSLATMLRSMESQMANMSVPVPEEEEVGDGARWTVTTEAEINGLTSTNVYTYELVERSAEGIVLEIELAQDAPEQDAEMPGMPAGSSVHLDRMHMSGSGRVFFDPTSLLPASMRSSSSGTVEMTVTGADGSSSEFLQELDMQVEMDEG
jgi:hypothetical protein